MEASLLWVSNHILYILGVFFSFFAAVGFLIFLRGFLIGLNQLVYIDSHEEHLSEARARATWGTLIMITVFIGWVVVEAIAALFGKATINTTLTLWILGVSAVFFVYGYLKK
jgi:hypothetical protein